MIKYLTPLDLTPEYSGGLVFEDQIIRSKRLYIKAVCTVCGEEYYRRVSDIKARMAKQLPPATLCKDCQTDRVYLKGGYRIIHRPNHPNARKNGSMAEHVFVMSEHIGRPLEPGENVHHKNGDRADNRIENLELWSVVQPAGQRISDKVRWAIELKDRYPEVWKRIRQEMVEEANARPTT